MPSNPLKRAVERAAAGQAKGSVTNLPGAHPDLALVERCRANVPGAFEELYRTHAPRLFGSPAGSSGGPRRRICFRRSS